MTPGEAAFMNASTAPCARDCRAQVGDVLLHRSSIDERDRPDAAGALERLFAQHASHGFAELRVRREIEMRRARMVPREAGKPVFDVSGVPDLARLAVADDVDARGDLLRDGVGDAGCDGGIEGGRVVRLAVVFLVQQLDHLAAARQAADVGRENPLGAEFHARVLSAR